MKILTIILTSMLTGLLQASPWHALEPHPNAHLGGWTGAGNVTVPHSQWFGHPSDTQLTPEGNLSTSTTTPTFDRGAAVALDTSGIPVGTPLEILVSLVYTTGNSPGLLSVWTGTGYKFEESHDRLWINPQSFEVTPEGNATASHLGSLQMPGVGDHVFSFEATGETLVVFLGASKSKYPFPVVEYGELTLRVIPEMSSGELVLYGFSLGFLSIWLVASVRGRRNPPGGFDMTKPKPKQG